MVECICGCLRRAGTSWDFLKMPSGLTAVKNRKQNCLFKPDILTFALCVWLLLPFPCEYTGGGLYRVIGYNSGFLGSNEVSFCCWWRCSIHTCTHNLLSFLKFLTFTGFGEAPFCVRMVLVVHFLKRYNRPCVSDDGHSYQNMSNSQQSNWNTQEIPPSHGPLNLPNGMETRNRVDCSVGVFAIQHIPRRIRSTIVARPRVAMGELICFSVKKHKKKTRALVRRLVQLQGSQHPYSELTTCNTSNFDLPTKFRPGMVEMKNENVECGPSTANENEKRTK